MRDPIDHHLDVGPVVLKDVARAAGVSTATVDRVLHGRPGVRAEVIPITRVALRERVARWHAALATARERERQRDLEDEDDAVDVAQADAQAKSAGGAGGQPKEKEVDATVVDAEYEEVKDKKSA